MAGRPRSQRGPRGALADRLRAARESRGISQAEAAVELGVGRSWLAMVESGSRRPSGLAKKYLEAWAAACLGEPYSLIPTDKKEP
jgi:transcriptional regulator with XRE-family HTH domain